MGGTQPFLAVQVCVLTLLVCVRRVGWPSTHQTQVLWTTAQWHSLLPRTSARREAPLSQGLRCPNWRWMPAQVRCWPLVCVCSCIQICVCVYVCTYIRMCVCSAPTESKLVQISAKSKARPSFQCCCCVTPSPPVTRSSPAPGPCPGTLCHHVCRTVLGPPRQIVRL